jgi:predicted GNAT superfamily acetyltransferase
MSIPKVTIRHCHTIPEFEEMVELEVRVWEFGERDVVPSQMYVVAAKIGGQIFGAFLEDRMAGFVLAYPGIRDGKPYLHSHMAAVLPEFRDLGIGRMLKLAQRDDALARGISLIEWTFDPLQTRNAYFNFCRLGVVARRYLIDVYGHTSSPLHAGLPTDRLVAEWHLDSPRVTDILAGQPGAKSQHCERLGIAVEGSSEQEIVEIQQIVRKRFQELFAAGYVATSFERAPAGGSYILEPSLNGV